MTDYAFLKAAPHNVGDWMNLPPVSFLKTVEVYIRECYELLYEDIQDLFEIGQRFIHISGNPGTGKSCFLWYVLVKILNDPAEKDNAIILQLVEDANRRTYQILPGGEELQRIDHPEASPYYTRKGTWLLTDQKFVGYAAAKTVLFASPKDDNWGKAVRLLDERKFTSLFMPPWSLEELKVLFFHGKTLTKDAINEFWVRFYLSGHIVRWYSYSLESVYSQLVTKVVATEKTVNATLLRGVGVDKGEFSHHIFCSWPSLDFTTVKSYTFISEWVADCFATACFRGELKDWNTQLLKLAADPDLRCAAGVLFERYVHHRLSQGGFFPSVDDPNVGLDLGRRRVKFFTGKAFPLEKKYLKFYLRPNSSKFPWWDSGCLPNLLVQVSMAKTRKPIPREAYEAQVSKMKDFWQQHPNAKSGLRGVSNKEVYAVLVKLEGDDHTAVPNGLQVWEPTEDGDGTVETGSSRKRRRTQVSRKQPKQTKPAVQNKSVNRTVTEIPYQMTIALRDEDGSAVSYEPLHVLFKNIKNRIVYEWNGASEIVDGTDSGYQEFDDNDTQEEVEHVQLLMRRGRGFSYVQELIDGEPKFAGSVTAKRTGETTELTIDCTVGRLEGQELRIFVDERQGTAIRYDDPFKFVVSKDHEGVWGTASDPSRGDEYEVLLSPTKMTVKIVCKDKDRYRLSKYFSVCVGDTEKKDEEDEDEDEDEDDELIVQLNYPNKWEDDEEDPPESTSSL